MADAPSTVVVENNSSRIVFESDGSIDLQGSSLKFNGETIAGGSLPDQTDNAGKVLTTNGVNPLWAAPSDIEAPAVLQHIVTLNDAQIKASPTGVVELVPAPGAGKRLDFAGAILFSDVTAGVYTNVAAVNGADDFVVIGIGTGESIDSASIVLDQLKVRDLLGAGGIKSCKLIPYAAVNGEFGTDGWAILTGSVIALHENDPLVLQVANSTGAFTGGNTANTLKIIVFYSVVDLA